MVLGSLVDQLLARTDSGGTTAWYLPDNVGTVRDIADTTVTIIYHAVYDSLGNITSETGATNGDRFKFAGMQYDSTIAQYYDHARWYGAGTGRFIAQDPTWFAGRDANLYRYVANDAVNASDPTGLEDPGGGVIVGPPNLTFPHQPDWSDPGDWDRLKDIANSRFMKDRMADMWRDHQKDTHPQRWEHGRWMLWNPTTGRIGVTSKGVIPVGPYNIFHSDPSLEGWIPIVTMHTHGSNGTHTVLPSPKDRVKPGTTASNLFPGIICNLNYYVVYLTTHDPHSRPRITLPQGR